MAFCVRFRGRVRGDLRTWLSTLKLRAGLALTHQSPGIARPGLQSGVLAVALNFGMWELGHLGVRQATFVTDLKFHSHGTARRRKFGM